MVGIQEAAMGVVVDTDNEVSLFGGTRTLKKMKQWIKLTLRGCTVDQMEGGRSC